MKVTINAPKPKPLPKNENEFSAWNIIGEYFQTIVRLGKSGDIWELKNGQCKRDKENKDCSEPECQVETGGDGPLIKAARKIFQNAWGLDADWKKLKFKL